jgi:ElaA protein
MDAHDGWHQRRFAELGPELLYAILALRQAVFVVEQDCPYLDCDGLDAAAVHLFLLENGALTAYERCLPPGTPYPESSIGRIIVTPAQRGSGLGRELVRRGIAFNRARWPGHAIRIGAQSRLTRFYQSLGFVSCEDHYIEDGIEHVHMVLAATA